MTLLVCPNGHAMDDGLTECPACGAYRAPGSLDLTPSSRDVIARLLRGDGPGQGRAQTTAYLAKRGLIARDENGRWRSLIGYVPR